MIMAKMAAIIKIIPLAISLARNDLSAERGAEMLTIYPVSIFV
ncbi:hypothetical protein [Sphingopyxis yananensis]|nr:hypothetical protein [Sphingopyxis yananensis]